MCKLCGDSFHFTYEDSLKLTGEAAQNFTGAWNVTSLFRPIAPTADASVQDGDPSTWVTRSIPVNFDGGTVGAPNEQGGPGLTTLLNLTNNGSFNSFSGDRNIDAVLIGRQWNSGIYQNMFYSFNTTAAQYGASYDIDAQTAGTQAIAGFSAFNAAQQAGARYAFGLIAGYTNAAFTEVSGGSYADFRFGNSTYPGSAFANFPSDLPQAGDMWFNTSQPFYSTAALGNWGLATIMHELGHSLGLKHGMDDYTNVDLGDYISPGTTRFGTRSIETAKDGQPYSLMTYRGGVGTPVAFNGDGFNQPQTFMQLDIAALQYMYGADYTSAAANAGNTVYEFSTTTGQMFVNGVGQGVPTSNKVFRTVWDGGGNDTIYLANYNTPMYLDLNAGGWLVFDVSGGNFQRVNNNPLSGPTTYAPGNVAMALMHQNNSASLIENAVGGTGDDILVSNRVANNFNGYIGSDWVSYKESTSGVIVDLGADASWDGSVGDTLLSIENIIGSQNADTFYTVKGEANRVNGQGGNDTLTYIGFNSYVFIDLLNGVVGDGTVNDFVVDVESAIATAFNDYLVGNANINKLNGGTGGADYFDGFGGVDTLDFSTNGRGVIVDMTSQRAWDGVFLDTFNRMEDVIGSVFNDTFYNDSGAFGNYFSGNGGNDTYRLGFGRTQSDAILDLNAGDAIIFSGYGAGTLTYVSGTTFRVTQQGTGNSETLNIEGFTSVAQLAGYYNFI